MKIINTEGRDLPVIYSLFEAAIAYQKRKGFPVWSGYDRPTLDADIADKRQFKILIHDQIACIFTICYEDKVAWRHMDVGDAIYLHRIVVNPEFKGRLVSLIMDWVIDFCTRENLKKIRIDTWANNQTIIEYYKTFGYKIVEYFRYPNSPELPVQARGNEVVLMEYLVDSQ